VNGVIVAVPETTTIEIKTETWKQLNSRKMPGDSFDDVIKRLLKETS
jgi:predicted CopG family antitoxin